MNHRVYATSPFTFLDSTHGDCDRIVNHLLWLRTQLPR